MCHCQCPGPGACEVHVATAFEMLACIVAGFCLPSPTVGGFASSLSKRAFGVGCAHHVQSLQLLQIPTIWAPRVCVVAKFG
jgi:hypothetical protein